MIRHRNTWNKTVSCKIPVQMRARTQAKVRWSGRDLNPRHTDFQSVALPTELPDQGACGTVLYTALFRKTQARPLGLCLAEPESLQMVQPGATSSKAVLFAFKFTGVARNFALSQSVYQRV